MNDFGIGDMVLVVRGRKTNLYEVVEIQEDGVWISDGWVQITAEFEDMELICKAKDRQDKRVPYNKYFK